MLSLGLRTVSHIYSSVFRNLPLAKLDAFPAHLQALCLTNFAQYTALLAPLQQSHQPESDRFLVQDEDCEVEMSGNWYAVLSPRNHAS